jgi:hypothetical protein
MGAPKVPVMICKRIIRAAHGLFTDQREALATFGGPPIYRHTGGDTLDVGQGSP